MTIANGISNGYKQLQLHKNYR